MIVLCIVVFIYFIFIITSIVNVFMLSIEKKNVTSKTYKNRDVKKEQVSKDCLICLRDSISLILKENNSISMF